MGGFRWDLATPPSWSLSTSCAEEQTNAQEGGYSKLHVRWCELATMVQCVAGRLWAKALRRRGKSIRGTAFFFTRGVVTKRREYREVAERHAGCTQANRVLLPLWILYKMP